MTSAPFVVSENGYWGEERIEPLTTLTDADVDVTVAAPTGGVSVVDERSINPEEVGEELAEYVVEVHENDERSQSPKPIAQVDADEYDAVVFLGGHGIVWDVNQDRHVRQTLSQAVVGDDSKVFVVCHAVGIFGFTREADSSLPAEGREVTGFPNEQEEGIADDDDLMPSGRKFPYQVEDEVKAVGGVRDVEFDSDTSVTVDGGLIIARGPGSSVAAVQTLSDEL